MKTIRLLGAALLVACAGMPRAALIYTINVDTFSDQNGSDPSHCSLREAVKAVNTRAPFGGCPAGSAFDTNVIQLQPGDYQLTLGEIHGTAEMTISGADKQEAARKDIKDPMTGLAPRLARPDYVDQSASLGRTGTYIYAAPNSRIFDMLGALTLNNVVLEGSASAAQSTPTTVDGNGGVIMGSSALTLRNVIVRGGSVTGSTAAAGNGGAVYLGGDNNGLTLEDVTIESSHADNKGGAVAVLCSQGLSPRANHFISISRSLLIGNSSTNGAGAIEVCGTTDTSLSASTLSGNTSAPSSGALAYVQGAEVNAGKINLSYVTAAEQVGHVLAVNGVAEVLIKGSLLARFNTAGATTVCFNPDPAVYWMASPTPTGHHNAIDDDASCDALLATSGNNVKIPLGTDINQVLVGVRATPYYPTTLTGRPYGMTDYYLPKVAVGSPILDRGEGPSDCSQTDQRGVSRHHGSACDIGAVERLQVTARDDSADSARDTDRKAIVDVLGNDSFGESDAGVVYDFATVAVQLVNDDSGHCVWNPATATTNPNRLIVSNDGVLTPDASPIVCTYKVVDTNPDPTANTSATAATVKVNIVNAAPNALNDVYVRPVGTPNIEFNPLTNDNDDGDGIYGKVGSAPDWAAFNPIHITTSPQLGDVTGVETGFCPGSTVELCVTPPLTYRAKNAASPFSDSFHYVVYDKDGKTSNDAIVTVATDAPDPDHGGGAGSLDLLAGLALAVLGLRRFRRL